MKAADSPVDRSLPILRKNRCSSGISNLDILLEGGYLKGGLIMFLGPTGMEKNTFAFHFADSAINEEELVVYITSDMSHEELIKKSSTLGFDFKKAMSGKNIIFIDCTSSSESSLKKSESIGEVIHIPGASALNDLSLAIKGILQENQQKEIRVIFHSLSTFVLYNPADSIIKFLQLVGGRLKKANATTLLLVEEGMHEKTVLASIQHMMDEMYTVHDSSNFSVESSSLPMLVPLKLGSAGIEVK